MMDDDFWKDLYARLNLTNEQLVEECISHMSSNDKLFQRMMGVIKKQDAEIERLRDVVENWREMVGAKVINEEIIKMKNDEIERLREALKKATRFSRYVLQESSFQGCELDGGYAQDVAESIGLIVPHIATEENRDLWEQYEGCEMGCTFFEFVDWMREDSTALKETE